MRYFETRKEIFLLKTLYVLYENYETTITYVYMLELNGQKAVLFPSILHVIGIFRFVAL